MGQFDFIAARSKRRDTDYRQYECPYCGAQCNMNMTECPSCSNSLAEFEEWRFRSYHLYNEALVSASKGKYCEALEKITLFLSEYPDDRDGNRLRLFIAHALSDERFDDLVSSYLMRSNDRWAAAFQDDPASMSVKEFKEKDLFTGNSSNENRPNPMALALGVKASNAVNLITIINGMYELYSKCRKLSEKRRNRRTVEFMHFYEVIFSKYLHISDITVVDYLNKNFNSLSKEEQENIGEVSLIKNTHRDSGEISRVYLPEIQFKNIIIQRARIEIVRPSKKKTINESCK